MITSMRLQWPSGVHEEEADMIGMVRMGTAALLAALLTLLPAAGLAQQKTLKINESLGPGSVEEAALQQFKTIVEEGSKGELQIAIHLQDALGKPDTALESLMAGSLDLYS